MGDGKGQMYSDAHKRNLFRDGRRIDYCRCTYRCQALTGWVVGDLRLLVIDYHDASPQDGVVVVDALPDFYPAVSLHNVIPSY